MRQIDTLGYVPTALAVSRERNWIVAASERDTPGERVGFIQVFDPSGSERWRIEARDARFLSVAVDSDGNVIARSESELIVFDPAGQRVRGVPVTTPPHEVFVDVEGVLFYGSLGKVIASRGGETVFIDESDGMLGFDALGRLLTVKKRPGIGPLDPAFHELRAVS